MRRIAVLIVLTAGFAAPPAATAQFGPPEINDPEVRADAFEMPGDQLVADAAGNALWASAAFGDENKRQMAVYERCGAAAAWPRVALLGEPNIDLWPQGIAVTPAGDALAVWRIADGASFSTFYSSARPAGGAWGAPQLIVSGQFGAVEFAVSDAGEAVAAWTSTGGVQASIRPAGGAWGAPTTLTANADQSAHVAMSAGGDAVVTSWDPPVWMRAFYRPAGGSWGGEETVEQTNYVLQPNSQRVEFDGQGRAVSVFSQNGFLHAAVRSGGAWGGTAILDETAVISVHTLARHPNGLVAVWNRKESLQSSNDQLGVARLGAGWEAKRLYDPPGRFMGATAAASSTGAILLAAAQEGGPSGDEDIVGVVVPSLVALWPDALPRISPASTPTALYRNPAAAGGGAALFLSWGVHGAPTDFSQAIATDAAPATCSGSQPPPPQPVPPTPPEPQPAPSPLPLKPTPKAIGGFVVLPPAKACIERRRLKVALRSREGFPVRRIAIAVKGKRVALRKGSKVTGTLTLRRLPRGRYKVAVTVTLADGTVVRGKRAYRACS